jgi:Xaa-Pro aminopeptidase
MPDWAARLRNIEQFCESRELSALVVTSAVNIKYLSGFAGSSGMLVCAAGRHCLITDGRYDAYVRDAMRAGTIAALDLQRVESRYDDALMGCLQRMALSRVGFEAEHVTVATLARWTELLKDLGWVSTSEVVERLRLIKDAGELDALRRGGKALSGVARSLGAWVVPGRTERDVARDIETAIERAGFERPAFPTIVAAGPNSAYPHATPTDRRLTGGDLVVLDFGGVLDGYCVDLTRMAGIGHIGSAGLRLYSAVREAQDAALAAVRSGVAGSDVDAAARQMLESHGLGAAFVHSTGHGLGLEVHEGPRLSRPRAGVAGAPRDPKDNDVLEAGMVCTIEPGAYVEGVGGVRLEDDVVVTIGGSEMLTDAPRDLLVV